MKSSIRFLYALLAFLPAFPLAAQTVVTETDITFQAEHTPPTNNWVAYTRNGGTLTCEAGPGTPPTGTGSLQFATPAATDKVFLYNYDHAGTSLSDITGLTYSTYRAAGNPAESPSIHLEIDYNGAAAGGYAILIFEPAYNPDQGTLTDNTWQTWDAYNNGNAIWWSSAAINGVCDFTCYVTWDYILANNPQAEILGGFGLCQGSGNAGLKCGIDDLTIAENGAATTYNFEAAPSGSPTTLPVTWLYFRGEATETGNLLHWATASEKNSSYFIVEQSPDGRNFEAVGEVKANGNSSAALAYTFLAENATVPAGKTAYYRLKQIDQDGSFVYSPAITVTREARESGTTSVYPNPFSETITLALPVFKTSQKVQITLTTPAGKAIYRQETALPAGSRNLEIGKLQDLPAGLYLLRVLRNDKLTVMKVIKQ